MTVKKKKTGRVYKVFGQSYSHRFNLKVIDTSMILPSAWYFYNFIWACFSIKIKIYMSMGIGAF